MLKSFLFGSKLTLLAKLYLWYLFFGIIIFPFFIKYPWMGITNILFGRGYSIQPFAYSLLLAICIYIPYLYVANKFINIKSNIILIYVYLFLFTIGMTIYMWVNTENGWQPMIIFMSLMFYPNKYAFVSNLILLTYIIINGKNYEKDKEDTTQNVQSAVKIIAAFVYLSLAAGIPYFLKWQNITLLDKTQIQTEQPFHCNIEGDILKTKECIDNAIIKKNNSFSEKWDKLIYRVKNPHRKVMHIIYNKDFIYKLAVLSDKFDSIKQCYSVDKCKFFSKFVSIDKGMQYDFYRNMKIRTESSGNYTFYASYDNKKQMNIYIPNSGKQYYKSRNYTGNIKQYIESKMTRKKDVILSKTNGIDELWAVGLEYIPLINDNYFIIVSIPRYIEQEKNEYGEFLFEYKNGYKFYTSCKGKGCYEQDLEISLNSRENPSVVYIRFGSNVYEINDIP